MEWKNCRLCGNLLVPMLELGNLYPSDFIEAGSIPEKPYPLVLAHCRACDLIQLTHSLDPDAMYREYWYRSSLNPTMVNALQDIVDSSLRRIRDLPTKERVVVDIGCNDGTMLSQFPPRWCRIGFDPALNLANEAREHCDYFINDYFEAAKMPPKFRKAHVVAAIAMFYDLNYPHSFLISVRDILAQKGIFVIQLTDLLSMLKQNAFDNICHEHVAYYSFTNLLALIQAAHLDVFAVERNSVNGGSIRVWACHPGQYPIQPSVNLMLTEEWEYMLNGNRMSEFAERVESIKQKVMRFLDACERDGGIYALGASTKGNTLLQYFQVTSKQIVAIGEIHKDKIGRRTIETDIPIISEQDVLAAGPNTIMILPWHFRDHFIRILADYISKGGSLLFPLPTPQLFTREGWHFL